MPHVCLFDTGINHGHPLIAAGLAALDLHTVEPSWGTNDDEGHGTEMAGVALSGNLTEALASQEPLDVAHRLESVKLLPADGANGGDARHHGYLTTEAVARPEITAPQRRRLFGMAVTARDNRDRGRPSPGRRRLIGLLWIRKDRVRRHGSLSWPLETCKTPMLGQNIP